MARPREWTRAIARRETGRLGSRVDPRLARRAGCPRRLLVRPGRGRSCRAVLSAVPPPLKRPLGRSAVRAAALGRGRVAAALWLEARGRIAAVSAGRDLGAQEERQVDPHGGRRALPARRRITKPAQRSTSRPTIAARPASSTPRRPTWCGARRISGSVCSRWTAGARLRFRGWPGSFRRSRPTCGPTKARTRTASSTTSSMRNGRARSGTCWPTPARRAGSR